MGLTAAYESSVEFMFFRVIVVFSYANGTSDGDPL